MKLMTCLAMILAAMTTGLCACTEKMERTERIETQQIFTRTSRISDVMRDPAFGDWGRLIFPVDEGYWSGETLEQLRLVWYNYIDPDKTVEICNYMKAHADSVFLDIYTEAEKLADPQKRDTGLFFFRGRPDAPFAVCNPVVRSPMSGLCTTAFLMLSNCPNLATMPLRSSIVRTMPTKTLPAPLLISMTMLTNWV